MSEILIFKLQCGEKTCVLSVRTVSCFYKIANEMRICDVNATGQAGHSFVRSSEESAAGSERVFVFQVSAVLIYF